MTTYYKGELSGPRISWYLNGQTRDEGFCQNGKEQGTWKRYYENQKKLSEFQFNKGEREGKGTSWYLDGKVRLEGTFSRDEPVGIWSYYYPNGKKNVVASFKDGEYHGTYASWYETGRKKCEGTMAIGKMNGVWIFWYENGNKKAEGMLKDNIPQGEWLFWYDNGKKSAEENYADGKLDGKRKIWDRHGSTTIQEYVRNIPQDASFNRQTKEEQTIPVLDVDRLPIEQDFTIYEDPPPEYTIYTSEPLVLKNTAPIFPMYALRIGVRGKVAVKMWINQKGRVQEAIIEDSDNNLLNNSALAAAYKWKFRPAIYENKHVSIWMKTTFRFTKK